MKKLELLTLLSSLAVVTAGLLGISTIKNSKSIEYVSAADVTKSRIVLEIEDQTQATRDAGWPVLHLWGITVDSSMDYDSSSDSTLFSDFDGASVIDDFELGDSNYRSLNTSDYYIESSFTKDHDYGDKHYWKIYLPWYLTGFSFKVKCGEMYSNTSSTVTEHGSYMVYLFAQGGSDGWFSQSTTDDSSLTNTYSVSNYTISAASSGGVSGDGHGSQVKGNGGNYTDSGNYFTRQKVSLKATDGTYSSFDHWDDGQSTSSATTFDYVGTANKTYTATFSDNRSTHTVTFLDDDGTPLETKTNVYQGSSVSPTSTPTKSDDGGKHYTFDRWVDAQGNDKTSALANVQADLTVYASYTVSYKSGRYILVNSNNIEDGYYMDTVNNQFEKTITLNYEDAFKIVYWTGTQKQEIYSGYNSFTINAEAYHFFGGDNNDNLVCYARGTYTLYYAISGPYSVDWSQEKWISAAHVGDYNAQHLAALLLQYGDNPDSNTCSTRFPAMREFYLTQLSSAEQSTFRGYITQNPAHRFRKAYERYKAWARALGEDPWSNAKANASLVLIGLNNKNTINIAILVIISVISVTAIGGYFFIRKRKENN